MKRIFVTLAVISLLFSGNLFSKSSDNSLKPNQTNAIVDNLLLGVSSGNAGLRLSCAYFLGELKSDKALIPLMRMLRSDKKESNRIMAALSLFKINSARAIYMLKREAVYNDSERVREMCKKFYDAYLMEMRTNSSKRESDAQTIAQSLR